MKISYLSWGKKRKENSLYKYWISYLGFFCFFFFEQGKSNTVLGGGGGGTTRKIKEGKGDPFERTEIYSDVVDYQFGSKPGHLWI